MGLNKFALPDKIADFFNIGPDVYLAIVNNDFRSLILSPLIDFHPQSF